MALLKSSVTFKVALIGCHLPNKSVCQISALLELPRSSVCAVSMMWKRLGATTAQPGSGRPHKLTEWDRRVLTRIATLTTEFQTASGSNVSTRTVSWGLHEKGFHGRAAAQTHKPMITMRNGKRRLEWWKRVLWSDESCFNIR